MKSDTPASLVLFAVQLNSWQQHLVTKNTTMMRRRVGEGEDEMFEHKAVRKAGKISAKNINKKNLFVVRLGIEREREGKTFLRPVKMFSTEGKQEDL